MITTVSSATDTFDDTVVSEDLAYVNAECGVLPQISDLNNFCYPRGTQRTFPRIWRDREYKRED
jgi:hypothetical protein